MLLQELLTLAVTETEEYHIHLVERHLAGELQFRFAYKALMNLIYLIAGIALTIGENNFCLWVIQQEANQLTSCITCSS